MQTDLTISLINHSNPELLRDCLHSLYAATSAIVFDVWVVDNATDRRLVPEIQAEFPQVKWLFNARREGFSKNHNQVLQQAEGRYVCILNDDTIVHTGAFDTLVGYMDANPEAGMAGARLLNVDGTQQDCVYRFPKLRDEPIHYLQLPRFLCRHKDRIIDPVQYADAPAHVDWILGACIVIRDSTLREVGGLDDVLSPIACMEEVDWCYRVVRAGWNVAYCPQAVITHIRGQSTKQKAAESGPDKIRVEMYKALYRYYLKHRGRGCANLLLLLHACALPWNTLMLTQALARRKFTLREYRNQVATFYTVAKLGLTLPLEAKPLIAHWSAVAAVKGQCGDLPN